MEPTPTPTDTGEICEKSHSHVRAQVLDTLIGQYRITACDTGVHTVGLLGVTDENFAVRQTFANRTRPPRHSVLVPADPLAALMNDNMRDVEMEDETPINDGSILNTCVEWMRSYFSKSEAPISPLPPRCYSETKYKPFEMSVWSTLASTVPFGSTITYGDLAKAVGNPSAARAVGTAMKNNPTAIIVPCHRVVKSGGALGKYHGGTQNRVKEWLLNHEKGTVNADGPAFSEYTFPESDPSVFP